MERPAAAGSRVSTPCRLHHVSSTNLDACYDEAANMERLGNLRIAAQPASGRLTEKRLTISCTISCSSCNISCTICNTFCTACTASLQNLQALLLILPTSPAPHPGVPATFPASAASSAAHRLGIFSNHYSRHLPKQDVWAQDSWARDKFGIDIASTVPSAASANLFRLRLSPSPAVLLINFVSANLMHPRTWCSHLVHLLQHVQHVVQEKWEVLREALGADSKAKRNQAAACTSCPSLLTTIKIYFKTFALQKPMAKSPKERSEQRQQRVTYKYC
uniref:Uncharacterized protein n=1 Tax=Steinernema glaseri TaxID=37863 RepID=A0A1I8ARB9_9BILA